MFLKSNAVQKAISSRLACLNKCFKIFCFFLLCSATNAYAGWYECYNFKGNVGSMPITLSLQIRKGYFGEPSKKNFNAIGIYKYDKYNSPIRLEGILDERSKRVTLYELTGEKYSAVFSFVFSENKCNGSWQNMTTGKKLPVDLVFISKLADLELEQAFSNVDIIQAQSLPGFYFQGSYKKIKGTDRAIMNKLRILRKGDGKLFQTIDLSNTQEPTGNLMTIIFDNLEVADAGKQIVGLSRNIGNDQSPLLIKWSARLKRFEYDESSGH